MTEFEKSLRKHINIVELCISRFFHNLCNIIRADLHLLKRGRGGWFVGRRGVWLISASNTGTLCGKHWNELALSEMYVHAHTFKHTEQNTNLADVY